MRKMEMKFSFWKNWTVIFAVGVCGAFFLFNDVERVQLLRQELEWLGLRLEYAYCTSIVGKLSG